jgi:hypothetical protein
MNGSRKRDNETARLSGELLIGDDFLVARLGLLHVLKPSKLHNHSSTPHSRLHPRARRTARTTQARRLSPNTRCFGLSPHTHERAHVASGVDRGLGVNFIGIK